MLVYDHGLGLPIARRIARDVKRVIYFSEWQEGFSTVNKAVIGDGFPDIERCLDIWSVKKDVDLFVFPDIQHAGLQVELEEQGYKVWGSRWADQLEINREFFLEALEDSGLQVPPHHICVGIDELRKFLHDKENKYIKISMFRGSLETKKWRNRRQDANLLDLWSIRFGGVRNMVRFLVFDEIDTPLEIGGDTYCVDGKWPSLMLHGIEWKDKSYFSAVTKTSEMPEQIQAVLNAFGPILGGYGMKNEWSMEVRVKDEDFFFIDPTPRLGLPSTGSQLETWDNYTEILWYGAHGILVEPKASAKFTAELIVSASADEGIWPCMEIPEELDRWLKLADCCFVDGMISFPREGGDEDHVGWLVANGDTPKETLDRIKEYVELLPDGLSADATPLADVIKEIEQEEDKGIEFTEEQMPQASEVIE